MDHPGSDIWGNSSGGSRPVVLPAPTHGVPVVQYKVGDVVMVVGLSQNPRFNGKSGKVIGQQLGRSGEDQILVVFDGEAEPKAILPSNLRQSLATTTITVTKLSGEQDLGCLLSEMVLRGVRASSPAERCGVGKFIGMRLTQVDGQPVWSREMAARALSANSSITLTFEGSSAQRPPPGSPVPPAVAPVQQSILPQRDEISELRLELQALKEKMSVAEQRGEVASNEARSLRSELLQLKSSMATSLTHVPAPVPVSVPAPVPAAALAPAHAPLFSAAAAYIPSPGYLMTSAAPMTPPKVHSVVASLSPPVPTGDPARKSISPKPTRVPMPALPHHLQPPPWEQGALAAQSMSHSFHGTISHSSPPRSVIV
eukprot:TRINITY_DN17305_c0_g1_i1.p1 TRINITY_DN17305_c0_g1~~TRINITY_DN17305_c0_g1_i1.p1  ORF type:complete len:370 (+),score=75.30 TRINITY_DN17305_c0_g1_i1:53-1162(+)